MAGEKPGIVPMGSILRRLAAGLGSASLWLAPAAAAAAPPVSPPLLAKLERDVAGALAHLHVLRAGESGTASGIDPTTRVALGAHEERVLLATLKAIFRSLTQRLARLQEEIRARRDPRIAQVLWIVGEELGRLGELLERLEREQGAARERTIALLERGLVQLDGATAALWTFDR